MKSENKGRIDAGCGTSWLVLGIFLYAETMDLKRRSILFTLHMAYMADIISWKNNSRDLGDGKKTWAEKATEKDKSRIISIQRPTSITIQKLQRSMTWERFEESTALLWQLSSFEGIFFPLTLLNESAYVWWPSLQRANKQTLETQSAPETDGEDVSAKRFSQGWFKRKRVSYTLSWLM